MTSRTRTSVRITAIIGFMAVAFGFAAFAPTNAPAQSNSSSITTADESHADGPTEPASAAAAHYTPYSTFCTMTKRGQTYHNHYQFDSKYWTRTSQTVTWKSYPVDFWGNVKPGTPHYHTSDCNF